MAETNILKQLKPSAAAYETLYTVPSATRTIISTLTICNLSATQTTIRVAYSPAGAAIADQHHIYYELTIPGNDTFTRTCGDALSATDVVRVYATLATIAFQITGIEVT